MEIPSDNTLIRLASGRSCDTRNRWYLWITTWLLAKQGCKTGGRITSASSVLPRVTTLAVPNLKIPSSENRIMLTEGSLEMCSLEDFDFAVVTVCLWAPLEVLGSRADVTNTPSQRRGVYGTQRTHKESKPCCLLVLPVLLQLCSEMTLLLWVTFVLVECWGRLFRIRTCPFFVSCAVCCWANFENVCFKSHRSPKSGRVC